MLISLHLLAQHLTLIFHRYQNHVADILALCSVNLDNEATTVLNSTASAAGQILV